MKKSDYIVGIDLGTTNSEIAVFMNDRVRVLGQGKLNMLPSCVGITPEGELLIGQAARNQQLVYPERTVRSIKRSMGSGDTVTLGDRTFTPQEISALILRELARWAHQQLGEPVEQAVITVPAYFSDAQRQATREAGALAGLDVVRIVNEPTAAALAYGSGQGERRTVMVYDLGGGTFDVSIVTLENDITEVLASHGNNQLGGDDFNQLIMNRLLQEFRAEHEVDLRDAHPAGYARLWWAAENAKQALSSEPFAKIREEALAVRDGTPLHLELELTRDEYEGLIRPLVEATLDSVTKALSDANLQVGDLDAVLLVGGSTRTPLIPRVLEQLTGITPEQKIHPDLCVALGAGVLAARLSGEAIEQVLVDVSPYSFGPSYLGDHEGRRYLHCYHPIIRRNTPLPVTRTESYWTAHPGQTRTDIDIFQGEDPDALKNIPVGNFQITDLTPADEPIEVLCRMSLDLDGILHVTAIEKATGHSKQIAIDNAMAPMSATEMAAASSRLADLFAARPEADDEGFLPLEQIPAESELLVPPTRRDTVDPESDAGTSDWERLEADAREILRRARALQEQMHADDREEAIALTEDAEAALSAGDPEALRRATGELRELLFFVEGA